METIIKLPPINLDHLRTLTNNTGIIEHSKFSIPNRKEGYTTDDNARALVDVLKYNEVHRASLHLLLSIGFSVRIYRELSSMIRLQVYILTE